MSPNGPEGLLQGNFWTTKVGLAEKFKILQIDMKLQCFPHENDFNAKLPHKQPKITIEWHSNGFF